jgi:hypothetical protein
MPDDDEFAADREKWESNEFASAFFDWWHQIKAPPAPDGPPLTYPIRGDRIWLSVECKILRSR